ncbi:nucleotide exchange factor GrpE [Salinibacterium sp. G-O1]|uniref:nucleotide exchange factor GrpE n=1 Tax=Salinibacterium sp. G-O1 TaxID=3046208 RepID=UPI0024BB7A8E|nr:nucleotide exchange factor GrpE [Salinibacterium sp. G-O1]MDJ0334597.1 nucleotide exchange factor GrpE [Salinibacterium sp. G-O1]
MTNNCDITTDVCDELSTVPPQFDFLVPAVLAVLVLLAVLVVVFLLLWRTTVSRLRAVRAEKESAEHRARSAATRASEPPPPPGLDMGLVDRLIDLADLATSPAVATQTERVLRYLGVQAVPAIVGEPFESTHHTVASTEPTDTAAQHERIVSVVRKGWEHDGALLRPADVTVSVLR